MVISRLAIARVPTQAAKRLWRWLREISGDAAYETYVRSHERRCLNAASQAQGVLTREQFYLDALRRRYSGVSRCC